MNFNHLYHELIFGPLPTRFVPPLRNTIPGDKSAMNPNGLRVGTPAMTSRGLMEVPWSQNNRRGLVKYIG